jgi:hypothetical protein
MFGSGSGMIPFLVLRNDIGQGLVCSMRNALTPPRGPRGHYGMFRIILPRSRWMRLPDPVRALK